ncbi:MAG TPA: energy transducer TonB [Polyangiaceae bacterium]|jgi:protein TonB|nr:energy transducer TonB [Polyangiaceae bacterium]
MKFKAAYVVGAIASVAIHVAAFGGLDVMKKPEPSYQRVSVMMSAPKKKQKAKPPEPPKPIEAPKEVLHHPLAAPKAAPPPPVAPPPDPVAAAHPALAAMPDFGISLSGTGPGGGIAIPMGGGPAPAAPSAVHKEKVFGAAAERPAAAAADDCQEELVKAKPQAFVQPTYTDDARAAGIEGRVRVEVTIDASGTVLSTKIVSGLGHGLDESAIAAAKRMSFNAATRCGKPVQSTFVISMRFVLGE